MRFRDPTDGAITIGDTDIRRLSRTTCARPSCCAPRTLARRVIARVLDRAPQRGVLLITHTTDSLAHFDRVIAIEEGRVFTVQGG